MPTCDTLPSAESAAQLARGDIKAIPRVFVHTAGRAALIGIGLILSGQREHVVRNALVGSLAIEVFVIGYQYSKKAP